MAGSLNKVQLIGNLGQDPEIITFENGGRVANLKVATSTQWKDKQGQKQEKTEWHSVSIFSEGLIAIVERYIQKGSKVYIEGSLQTRKWVDKQNNDRYTTEIVIRNYSHQIIMLGGKSNQFDSSQNRMNSGDPSHMTGDSSSSRIGSMATDVNDILPDDDIPF